MNTETDSEYLKFQLTRFRSVELEVQFEKFYSNE